MFRFLAQPYPFEVTHLRKTLLHNFYIGLFIAFFLIVFQPFNTDIWTTDYKVLKLLGYGVVSFLMPTLLHLLTYTFFDSLLINDKWVIWKEMLYLMLTLVLVAIGNLLYSNTLGIMRFSFASFTGSLISVGLVGIFPIFASVLTKYNRFLSLNKKEAAELETNLQSYQKEQSALPETPTNPPLTLWAENEKDSLSFTAQEFVYIESADNYANIAFLKNNKLQKELLRGTLKRFESQLHDAKIARCHRSYIVNLHHAEHIKGNAQGYRLTLRHADIVVPVARNYGGEILQKLNK